MAPSTSLSLSFLLLLQQVFSADLQCYDYSGNESPGALVCDPTAEVSLCCAPGNICYSNSLCAVGPTNENTGQTPWYMGACTNRSMPSPQCKAVNVCTNEADFNGGNGVKDCGDGNYCCYGFDGCDCNNQTVLFTLDRGNIVTTLPAKMPSATSTSSSKSASTSANNSNASSPSDSSHASGLSSSASIGAGVGVGVGGLLLFAAVGLGVFFCIRRRSRARGTTQQVVMDGGADGYEGKPAGHHELHEHPLAEKEGQSRVRMHELDLSPQLLDSRSRSELHGSSAGR